MRIPPIRVPAVLRELPWADASHAALVSAAPAVLAVLVGEPRLGWSAIAAFWACFADPGGPLAQRLRAMCWVAAVGALFCFLASASKDTLWLLLPLTFVCCTAASFAQLWGPAAAIIGTLVSAGFVVSTELPTPTLGASAAYAAFFIGGGLWSIVMTALVWRRRPWRHAAAAVAQCYAGIGEYTAAICLLYRPERPAQPGARARWHEVSTAHRKALRAQIETARQRVSEVLGSRPSRMRRGQQLLALLDAAERAFVVLVALADTMASLSAADHPATADAADALARRTNADVLRVMRRFAHGCRVTSQISNVAAPAQRQALQNALARTEQAVRQAHARTSAPDNPTAATLLPLLDRLFSAGTDAVSALLSDAPETVEHGAAATPTQTTSAPPGPSALSHLRRNLDLRSSITRHAIRVGVAATVSVALCKWWHINHGYWMSLTVVFILQPYLASTWQRTAERIVGSVAGAIGASLIGILLPSPLAVAVAVVPIALGTFLGRTVHYAVFTFFLTLQFVLVAEIQQPAAHEFTLAALRGMNSIYGGVLGLLIGMLLWPERANERLAAVLSEAVERHARYVLAVLRATQAGDAPGVAPGTLRREACLSADNAQVVLHSLMRSPLHRQARAHAVGDLIAALRGMTAAATVLELQPLTSADDREAAPRGKPEGPADGTLNAAPDDAPDDERRGAAAVKRYADRLDAALRHVVVRIRQDAARDAVPTSGGGDAPLPSPEEPSPQWLRPADPRFLALQRIAALGQAIGRFPDRAQLATRS
ncbi:FUSC family protein [Robbsia sp. Bb-Pol-6]|uniref:FUSC family protein n=1 Tax=Robbsia betulipollinis TaxID=2981849 RepID=A0ABT3ZL39_9BURK|nr:FUSC family protein [Robbsia betulipollinis]MCY0387253.1 FUSC family protein [Robbsia betulipollinis]